MKRSGSLFLSITALFISVVLGSLLVLWAGVSGGFAWGRTQFFQRNLERYVTGLVDDLGVPPSQEMADRFEEELGFRFSWTTGGQGVSEDGFVLREGRGYRIVRGDWVFLVHPRTPLAMPNWLGLSAALPVAALIWGLGWWRLRALLSPLSQLSAAARLLGTEDWSARAPEVGVQELQTLAQTFNRMADRIQAAWKSQTDLMAAVSHEFRSPLTRMRVALELLPEGSIRTGLVDDLKRLDRVTSVLLERERLAQRPEILTRELTPLALWLDDAVAPFRTQGLTIDLRVRAAEVLLDRTRMTLVISNLLENAKRHGGPRVHIQAGVKDSWVSVTVEDNGPGMPGEQRASWGTPFGPSRGGHGLGSSLVCSILQAHGGEATVTSPEGRGLLVQLTWPGSPPPSERLS